MIHQFFSVFAFCGLVTAVFGLGRPMLRGLKVGQDDRLSVLVWSMALGLLAAGLGLLGFGLLGILYRPVIFAATVLACFWGVAEMVRAYMKTAEQEGLLPGEDAFEESIEPIDSTAWSCPAGWLLGAMFLAAGAACVGSLIGALAPPTAGDALCYHLELPKAFLAEHRIAYLPNHDNSTFPLFAEMWYLWALALDGGVCAQLVHWGLGLLLALATVVLASPILGRPWGWIAGALVVLIPGVSNQMTAPLNDVALAAFTTLAMAAWWQAVVGREEGRRWFVLAGLMAGGALGTKYVALLFAVAVAATWIWHLVRQPERRRFLLEGAATVAVVAASVGGTWYVRAAWHRGNPVFPFFSEVFDRGEAAAADLQETLPESKSPLGRGPVGLATAPWQTTMHPEQFGGRGHQLGVVFLAVVPGLLFCRRLRGLGLLLATALAYGVGWYLLRQNVRFLFPVVPLFCVVTVWVWTEIRRFPRHARWAAGVALAGMVAGLAAIPLVRTGDQWAVAVGRESREDYLGRHEPTYPAAAVFNALRRPNDRILSQDYRAFYFDGQVTRENIYRRYTHYDQTIKEPAELSRRLREAGFTYLLLAETIAGNGIQYDPTLSRLADAQLASESAGELRPLTEYEYHDCDGAVRRYRLVAIR
jgi:hypothetical protein